MAIDNFALSCSRHINFVLSLTITLGLAAPVFSAGSPCDLFSDEELAKLSNEDREKVKAAIRECQRKFDQPQKGGAEGSSSINRQFQVFEYSDENGRRQVYHGQDMRAAFPERGNNNTLR